MNNSKYFILDGGDTKTMKDTVDRIELSVKRDIEDKEASRKLSEKLLPKLISFYGYDPRQFVKGWL